MLSDKELATRVAVSNDSAAFTQLVEQHQLPIRQFLRRLTAGDHSTADDLAQDTFLVAYKKLGTWSGAGTLKSWLHTIAYRQFLDHIKKHSRMQVMAEVPQDGFDTRQALDAEILVQKLLGKLGTTDRTCITLAYAAGMSHSEISAIVELPLGSVKSRIHRAKLKLQKWLEQHDHPVQNEPQTPPKEIHHAG